LPELAASLRGQTLLDRLTVRIIDDQSPQPASSFLTPDSVIEIERNPHNLGMVGNWNRCLQTGQHSYVHVLHYDDLIAPEFYERVLPIFEQSDKIGLVYTGTRLIYTRKTSFPYWLARLRRNKTSAPTQPMIFPAGDEAVRRVSKGVICSAVVLRRAAVEDVGLFRADLKYSADEEYWARLAKRWSVAYLPDPLVSFRYHSANHELATWVKPDFWELFQKTRAARFAHLEHVAPAELEQERRSNARLAVSIATNLLAKGCVTDAQTYLERAVQADPDIRQHKWFKRISAWVEQGSWGQLKARISSQF